MMMLDGVFAQVPHSKEARDYRAALDIRGRITEISVSPDEHIWLATATGNLYYANGIDADWHSSATDTRKNKRMTTYGLTARIVTESLFSMRTLPF